MSPIKYIECMYSSKGRSFMNCQNLPTWNWGTMAWGWSIPLLHYKDYSTFLDFFFWGSSILAMFREKIASKKPMANGPPPKKKHNKSCCFFQKKKTYFSDVCNLPQKETMFLGSMVIHQICHTKCHPSPHHPTPWRLNLQVAASVELPCPGAVDSGAVSPTVNLT